MTGTDAAPEQVGLGTAPVVVEPSVEELCLSAVLGAMADPSRRALLRVLAEQGASGCAKAAEQAGLTIAKSTLSHHLRTLREGGVITAHYLGATKIIGLRTKDLESRFPGLLTAVLDAPENDPSC